VHYSGWSEETIAVTAKAMLCIGFNCRAPFSTPHEKHDQSFKAKLVASATAGAFAAFGAKVEELLQPRV